MPGPSPKDPSIRQRRNKSTSLATLPAESVPLQPVPNLPDLPDLPHGKVWHPMAQQWWDAVWSSPMHFEFLGGDEPALFRLVWLVNDFWQTGKLAIAKEIRVLEREFGLTPLARRRLEWSVTVAEDAKDKHEKRRGAGARVLNNDDPREALSK